jgi:hypothetical protein
MPSVRQVHRPLTDFPNYFQICADDAGTSTTGNGDVQQIPAAPAVHVMYTEGHAAESGAAADAQHFEEGEGGRAQHHREAAKGCAAIWACRYDGLLCFKAVLMCTGAYVPLNPSLMRNRWFPARVANYVPATQMKQLKASELDLSRDVTFGVRANLEEVDEDEDEFITAPKHYVRPIEIDVLSVWCQPACTCKS